ncbi:MAG: hypothetical protein HKM87_00415, partial [Ignavibacteriaceae bacterium]|nr:hypothetical protein [Ignavibacteriaceae bacterium]
VKKREEILENIEQRISVSLSRTNNSLEEFLWADRITNFCDWVSFNFCYEKDFIDKVEVYTRRNSSVKTELTFQSNPAGEIGVDPWPFSAKSIKGFINAYEKEDYPIKLKSLSKEYHIIAQKIPANY